MHPHRAAVVAWSAFGLTVALAAATAAFGVIDNGTVLPADEGGGRVRAGGDLLFTLVMVTFALLGALVASRRPRNPIGWILCLPPLALGLTGVARGWYNHAFFAEPGSTPAPDALIWVANWVSVLGFMPLLTLLLLLFPDGRPVSRRWRPAIWLSCLAMGLLVVGYAFEAGRLEDYPRVNNPVGVSSFFETLLNLGFPLFAVSAIASMASLVVRFRRSAGEERQQLRWMAAAAALVVVLWMLTALFDQGFGIDISAILTVSLLALPAATAVAVLRYRLYDLDRVVNRTLVYGALSATLVGSYLGIVVLLQLALSPITSESDLAIAGSTLAVAALFRPVRHRIQELVDRRFYRRRYDAARTLDAFGARLRDEVDLDALGGELRAVVRETVQPSHVSLWLRTEAGR